MDEVVIRTLNDISDAESEMNFETENTNECTQSCDIIKEVEYENVSELDDICSEYQGNEYLENGSDSESTKPPTSTPGFSWDTKTTLLLLREYKLRLEKFRNPKCKKSVLWNEISSVFSSYGFDVHHAYLNKKFRNMKNTFVNIFFSNIDQGGNRPIKWDYYNIFLDLFKDDETFKFPASYEVLETSATVPIESLSDKELHLLPVKSVSKANPPEKTISFNWNQEKCMLLLNEYKSRLEQFRNPKKPKKELWSEINDVFQSLGYDVNEEILYKKFRNMKQTYMSNLNSGKKVKWIYHAIFSEIFDDIPTTNVGAFTSEYESDTVNSSPETIERPSAINETSTDSVEDNSKYNDDKFESLSNYQSAMLEMQNKRYRLDIVRTSELKKLRLAMEESNRLQEKRNILLSKFIDVMKQRNEDGEFAI